MPGNFSLVYVEAAGNTITAARRNAEFQNIINKMEPQYMDDYSANTTEMRDTTDPGESGTESLATSLQGEIERLRFAILEIKQALDSGLSYWYESPTTSTVTGPSASVDNTIARFNGTSGAIQGTNITVTDLDVLTLADTTITTSGSGTTYSTTTVADASAWDLSDVIAGDVVSADGSLGVVSSVNDGTDTITVSSWDNGTPSNTSVATVLRRAKLELSTNAENLLLDDLENVMDSTFANEVIDNYTRATGTSVSARGVAISSASGNFNTSATSATDITNLSVTITTSGRPVRLCLISAEEEIVSFINITENSSGDAFAKLTFVRDSTTVSGCTFGQQDDGSGGDFFFPVSSFEYIDTPTAGTYTYKVQGYILNGDTLQVQDARLVAYEL